MYDWSAGVYIALQARGSIALGMSLLLMKSSVVTWAAVRKAASTAALSPRAQT